MLVLGSSLTIYTQSADDPTDIVGWSDVSFIIPLVKKEENGKQIDRLTIALGGVFRYGRDLSRPIDERSSVTLNYRLDRYFSIGSGYLHRRSRLTEAPKAYEHRLMFYLTGEKQWPAVVLKNRAMTTYVIRHSRPDTVIFRNRIQANFPIKKEKKVLLSPFSAVEPFYDFRLERWFRNDVFLGVTRQFTRTFGADLFFVHQNLNAGTLRRTNGFGMSFRYRIETKK